MKDNPRIPYVTWRRGRPRFEPSPTLRAAGFTGHDLKTDDGRWMSAGEALDWSRDFARQLAAAKRQAPRRKAKAKPADILARRQEAPPAPPAYSLERLFDDWLNPSVNPGIADRAKKTVYEYGLKRNVLRTHLPDVWSAEAGALDKVICAGMYDTLRAKLGVSQAHSTMRVLGIALAWAMKRGKVPSDMQANPAHGLGMKTPDARLRVATPAEFRHLVATADRLGRRDMGDMFTLAIWSGQRQADRLEFELVRREAGRMIFRQQKTGVVVEIKEAEELTARLKAAAERRQLAGRRSPYAVLDERAWAPFTGDHYRKEFDKIRRAAAREMKSLADFRDQDFRDTAVTWLARAGATPWEIAAITGHSFGSINTILKHYLALHQEMADTAISKMQEWLRGQEAA